MKVSHVRRWFGDILRAAGIRVFPVQGVDNMPGLIDSEIISVIGIRIATLSDDTSVARIRSGKQPTKGDKAIFKMAPAAMRAGVTVYSVGLSNSTFAV